MKKKFFVLPIITLMTLSICSCGNTQDSSDGKENSVPKVESKEKKEKSEYYFKDGVLVSEDAKIEILDYSIVNPEDVEYSFMDKPEIAFHFKATKLTDKDFTAKDAFVVMFDAVQDNDPDVVNTLEYGWYIDKELEEKSEQNIKEGCSAEGVCSFELDDLETPVKLIAHRGIGGEYLGEQVFEIK